MVVCGVLPVAAIYLLPVFVGLTHAGTKDRPLLLYCVCVSRFMCVLTRPIKNIPGTRYWLYVHKPVVFSLFFSSFFSKVLLSVWYRMYVPNTGTCA